jgi:hemerythrin superfamily protein
MRDRAVRRVATAQLYALDTFGLRGGVVQTVIELLTEDHRLVDRLFEHYASTRDDEAASQLGDALLLHARIEEEFLYPLVRHALVDGDRLADEAEADHEKVKEFVAEAEDTHGRALDELVFELRTDVAVHLRWEEEDLFPRLEEVLDVGAMHELAQRALAFKRSQPVA